MPTHLSLRRELNIPLRRLCHGVLSYVFPFRVLFDKNGKTIFDVKETEAEDKAHFRIKCRGGLTQKCS